MARIDVLPSIEIIRGFKGILDFYLWRGLPCVRAWPKYRPAKQTAASLAAALTFGAIVKSYSLLANQVLTAYRQDALDQPRTARDIMVTGVFGNLHEATMSDFLDALIIIRDAVVSLTDLLHALDSIDTDELVVNVDQSALPAGASTLAEQQTQTTALAKLDDLQDALQSVALDRLLVRGMDQLFTYKGKYRETIQQASGGAAWQTVSASAVPAGEVWVLTSASAINEGAASTRVDLRIPAIDHLRTVAALAQFASLDWQGHTYLETGARLQVAFLGTGAGNNLVLSAHGYKMTLET